MASGKAFMGEMQLGEAITINLKLPSNSYSGKHIDDIFGVVCQKGEEEIRIISAYQNPDLRSIPYVKDGRRVTGLRVFRVPLWMILGYERINHTRRVR